MCQLLLYIIRGISNHNIIIINNSIISIIWAAYFVKMIDVFFVFFLLIFLLRVHFRLTSLGSLGGGGGGLLDHFSPLDLDNSRISVIFYFNPLLLSEFSLPYFDSDKLSLE